MFGNHLGERTSFTRCHKVPFESSLSDQKVFETPGKHIDNVIDAGKGGQDHDLDMDAACTWLDMKARTPGFSRTKVMYQFPALAGNVVKLMDEVMLAAFKPLVPVQPASGETLLSVESSLQIVWGGGPLPWINKPEYHYHK